MANRQECLPGDLSEEMEGRGILFDIFPPIDTPKVLLQLMHSGELGFHIFVDMHSQFHQVDAGKEHLG